MKRHMLKVDILANGLSDQQVADLIRDALSKTYANPIREDDGILKVDRIGSVETFEVTSGRLMYGVKQHL